ncbi:transmembrane protein 167 [Microsporum canis CBS 113480]|uniref:Transmembrane protein 167 n=1 Tax=Arthroderma otae (strain ATCC MYA-4605 / CBS 113480) TaxID=554155 RepID=C5G0M8_ARTOC|nr:transmembrane protein 167 [Microsporum canis CBS 113480]EEQ35681.1 transmembrane protein 167 [Microsporum canis CBS 113480]
MLIVLFWRAALFNFQSLLLVILLIICTSAYAHSIMPGIMDRHQNGYYLILFSDYISVYTWILSLLTPHSFFGIFWKCARVGERLSPYVSICCIIMAVSLDSIRCKNQSLSDCGK